MSTVEGPNYTSYEVISQEDENGDLLIPIPPILLSKLGWRENDKIEITLDDQGRYVLSKSKL